jgi:hypothetical protein
VNNYGFKKLPVQIRMKRLWDPCWSTAPSVQAGHVEIRTETGFVSDFRSKIPSRRP